MSRRIEKKKKKLAQEKKAREKQKAKEMPPVEAEKLPETPPVAAADVQAGQTVVPQPQEAAQAAGDGAAETQQEVSETMPVAEPVLADSGTLAPQPQEAAQPAGDGAAETQQEVPEAVPVAEPEKAEPGIAEEAAAVVEDEDITAELAAPVPEDDAATAELFPHQQEENPATQVLSLAEQAEGPEAAKERNRAAAPPAKKTAGGGKAPAKKGKKKKLPRKRSAFGIIVGSIFKTLFVLFCLAVIAVSVVAVQVSQYMAEATANDADVLDLDNLKLNLTSTIWAPNPNNPNAESEGDYIKYQELTGPQHRIWVEYKDIPEDLVDAIIAIEDRDFLKHHGVSFRRTAMAAINQVIPFADTDFGASTIEQQLVKNLTGDDETDYQRKLREMFRAWGLDSRYSKQTIMEAYLNTISLSGTIAGVQAGAQDYFGKNVSDLTLAECATIAGITRAPGFYDPYERPENALGRRNRVLFQMLDTGKITQAEYDEAVAQPLGVKSRTNVSEGLVTNSTFSYFTDALFNDVVEDLMREYGYTKEAATNFLYTGGLRIEATVDVNLQSRMENIFEHGYDETEEAFFTNLRDPRSGQLYKTRLGVTEEDENGGSRLILPQAAMTTIDYSGAVRGMVGGIGAKEGDLQLNRAAQSPRQVGSTMKPIAAYALAIDQGLINYSTMVVDSGVMPNPQEIRRDPETGAVLNNWPQNYSRTYRNTTMPVVSAIAESTNTVAVKVGLRVGIEPMYNFLNNTLEISTLVGEGSVSDLGPSALILGGLTRGITTEELAGAYQMFGNAGRFNSVHTYTRVLDSNGNVILRPEINHTQAISPEAAYVMNRMLWTVLRSGNAPGVSSTANRMALEGEMDSVAKTGTTSDDKDRWFVGLTPYYVTAVWWGYDDPQYRLNRWSPVATGNIPPLLWKAVMEEQQAGMPLKEFPEKPETVEEARYCAVSGERAGRSCPRGGLGYFISGIRSSNICALHN